MNLARYLLTANSSMMAVALSLGVATLAQAQSTGLVMSSPEAQRTYSTVLESLVNLAYPAYVQAELETRLTNAGQALAQRSDTVRVRSLAGIERLMGFSPSTSGGSEVETAVASYGFDAASGKAHAQHKGSTHTSLSREAFQRVEATIIAAHHNLLGNLGLPTDELMKVSTHKLMVQTLDENSTNNSDGTPATVRGSNTLGYRGFQGFPIEGSMVRISSFNEQRVERFSLRWPKFALHPDVSRVSLASADVIKRGILESLKAQVSLGQSVNLVMGVVFRPGKAADGRLVHVPAMKVVLTPAAKAGAEGAQSEAGHEFYANILARAPSLQSEDVTDPGTSAR